MLLLSGAIRAQYAFKGLIAFRISIYFKLGKIVAVQKFQFKICLNTWNL